MVEGEAVCHGGFFHLRNIYAEQAQQSPDTFEQLRTGNIQGALVDGVFTEAEVDALVDRFQKHSPPFPKSWFPTRFNSFFYGQNLNLAEPDLQDYFLQAKIFDKQLKMLAAEGLDLVGRISAVLSALDNNGEFIAAPGPGSDDNYMFATIRGHLPGGYIPPHSENEYPRRRSYTHLRSIADAHIYSYILAFTLAESGGELEIFDSARTIAMNRDDSIKQSEDELDLSQCASARFRIPPGSMFLFDSGRYVHQLRTIEGARTRWTISSFMAKSLSADSMLCWG
jgi:hypothetical protein